MLYNETINGNIFLVTEINARKCKNGVSFCKEFRKSFMLPENPYYDNYTNGDNIWDLESHHNERNYKVIIRQFKSLDDKQKAFINEELEYYKKHYDSNRSDNKNNFIVEFS